MSPLPQIFGLNEETGGETPPLRTNFGKDIVSLPFLCYNGVSKKPPFERTPILTCHTNAEPAVSTKQKIRIWRTVIMNGNKNGIKLYNVLFPFWILLLFPQVWLIVVPGNFIIDSLVFLVSMLILKITEKKH